MGAISYAIPTIFPPGRNLIQAKYDGNSRPASGGFEHCYCSCEVTYVQRAGNESNLDTNRLRVKLLFTESHDTEQLVIIYSEIKDSDHENKE
jgi:hypothetical protein